MLSALTGLLPAAAQTPRIIEDFEFASSDQAAAAGVIDLSDPHNQPTFFISGTGGQASPQEPGGRYSIGTDAVFCINPDLPCEPGTFIGFRRWLSAQDFPDTCPGGRHYMPLEFTYGDPQHTGNDPPDRLLSEIRLLWDAYGDGPFADGPTGTHLWLRLVDCEGEKYEFINLSEESLYDNMFTLDVLMGRSIRRISPQSLINVPNGDRLLTEIAAIEVLIQDTDDPPTTFGEWYVDYLRLIEPPRGDGDGDGDVDLADWRLMAPCLDGPERPFAQGCSNFDIDDDDDVDLEDASALSLSFGSVP